MRNTLMRRRVCRTNGAIRHNAASEFGALSPEIPRALDLLGTLGSELRSIVGYHAGSRAIWVRALRAGPAITEGVQRRAKRTNREFFMAGTEPAAGGRPDADCRAGRMRRGRRQQ